jgi:hypothetical protein
MYIEYIQDTEEYCKYMSNYSKKQFMLNSFNSLTDIIYNFKNYSKYIKLLNCDFNGKILINARYIIYPSLLIDERVLKPYY